MVDGNSFHRTGEVFEPDLMMKEFVAIPSLAANRHDLITSRIRCHLESEPVRVIFHRLGFRHEIHPALTGCTLRRRVF